MAESPFYVGLCVVNPLGHVLLAKRKEDGIWTGPGGGANPGEDPKDAAIREAFEESGLKLAKDQLEELPHQETRNGKCCYCFLAITDQFVTNTKQDPDEEVNSWKWYRPEDFPKGLSKDKNRITTVNNGLMRFHGLTKSDPAWLKEMKESGKKLQSQEEKERLLQYIQGIRDKEPDRASRLYERFFPKDYRQDTDMESQETPKTEEIQDPEVKKAKDDKKDEKKPLNKPMRADGGSKFKVYVKDPKTGNTKTVRFGDPDMEIKRDDKERRQSFRARHNCDNPGPKTKARYWSCKMWQKDKSVSDMTKSCLEALELLQYDSLMNQLQKGGPGSGKRGHRTLKEKPSSESSPAVTKLEEHLKNLKSQATFEQGGKTQSGKPMYMRLEDAQAHGYEKQDHRDAMNAHYETVEKINKMIGKMSDMGKNPPDVFNQLMNFHRSKAKMHMNAAGKVDDREKEYKEARQKKKDKMKKADEMPGGLADKKKPSDFSKEALEQGIKVEMEHTNKREIAKEIAMDHLAEDPKYYDKLKTIEKSVTSMANGDHAEIRTEAYAKEREEALKSEWLEKIYKAVEGQEYGTDPAEIDIDVGKLYLAKVEDGMYTGYVTKVKPVLNEDSGSLETMEDDANVRIERQTLPTLVNFLMAKEYINPIDKGEPEDELEEPGDDDELIDDYSEEEEEYGQKVESLDEALRSDRKLRMLELIDKLIN